MVRQSRSIVFLALLCAVVLTAVGCGEQVSPTPSSTAPALSADAAGAEALSLIQEYKDALTAWADTYWFDADGDAVGGPEFEDIAQPTDVEIADARQFAADMREALAALEAISPPAEISQAHLQYCTAFNTQLNALDRMISAIEWGSERDAELAIRAADEAYALESRALEALVPYIEVADVFQN